MRPLPNLKPLTILALTLMLMLAFGACTPGPSAIVADPNLVQSSAQRLHQPAVPGDLQAVANANNAFALDFYRAVHSQPGNLFYSPYSLSLALAMTYAGARGETAAQMAHTLHFSLPPERLHPAIDALDLQLQDPGQPMLLTVANSLWGQKGQVFQPAFLDTLAQNYGAGLRLADFAAQPEPTRQQINQWVAQQTKDRIRDLIPAGGIDPSTRLALAHAIYFKAEWATPFDPENTHDAPFHPLQGADQTVKMMSLHINTLPYLREADFQALELPYRGAASMILLLPDPGAFEHFEAGLDEKAYSGILAGLQPQLVALSLPKFHFETPFTLAQTLGQMGMPDAFKPSQADFSGMDGQRDLFIGQVIHKAFVAVDEKGTEAAAATAIGLAGARLDPQKPVVLTFDRPFVFLIRDQKSGAVLFAGRLVSAPTN